MAIWNKLELYQFSRIHAFLANDHALDMAFELIYFLVLWH